MSSCDISFTTSKSSCILHLPCKTFKVLTTYFPAFLLTLAISKGAFTQKKYSFRTIKEEEENICIDKCLCLYNFFSAETDQKQLRMIRRLTKHLRTLLNYFVLNFSPKHVSLIKYITEEQKIKSAESLSTSCTFIDIIFIFNNCN
jgi:hypothetical protein